jgi:hypothetical protein
MPVNTQQTVNLPVVALVLANLVPVLGVLCLDWDVGSIVVLYWAENLIVGGYTLLKMLATGGFDELSHMLFFCIHYGFFCVIHGLAILELTRFAGEVTSIPAQDSWPGPLVLIQMLVDLGRQVLNAAPEEFLWACLGLLLSHGVSFVLLFIGQQEYRQTTTRKLMSAPYKRIAVLQITVIAGGFLIAALGSPTGMLVVLVAFKTGMDIMLHNRSHKTDHTAETGSTSEKTQGEQQWK